MPISEVYNMDCMEYMKGIPDKFFDLAIVDPQYGIDIMHKGGMPKHLGFKQYKRKDWDKSPPGKKYFEELFRVSKNQIIFGGNYFTTYLPPKMGWIVWDKGQHGLTMSDGELAWSSFDKALRIITLNRCTIGERGGNIHRCQKPVKLYAEMNDGVYFDQNGNEVIVINGFEYSREEFDSLVDMCGDCNM